MLKKFIQKYKKDRASDEEGVEQQNIDHTWWGTNLYK